MSVKKGVIVTAVIDVEESIFRSRLMILEEHGCSSGEYPLDQRNLCSVLPSVQQAAVTLELKKRAKQTKSVYIAGTAVT